MKKIKSLLAVLLSTLFILSGCSSDLPEQSTSTKEPTQVASLQTTQEADVQVEETQKPEITKKTIQATAPAFDLRCIYCCF